MNFIIGLGNPGDQYKLTKHNFGFWVLDKLIEDRSLTVKVGKGDYIYAKDNKNILFLGKYFISDIFTFAPAQQAEINCKP